MVGPLISSSEFTINYWSWSGKHLTSHKHTMTHALRGTHTQSNSRSRNYFLTTKTQPNQEPKPIVLFSHQSCQELKIKIFHKLNLLGKWRNLWGGLFRWPDEPRRTFLSSRPGRVSWQQEREPRRTTTEQHENLCCHWLKQKNEMEEKISNTSAHDVKTSF